MTRDIKLHQGDYMRKVILSLLVVALGALGFSKLASAVDANVAKFQVQKANGDECGNNFHH